MAIFLWNMAGRPSANLLSPSQFSDISAGDAGYPAIAWMAQNHIAFGEADGTFGVDKLVTRKQMAQFLYRLDGSPSVTLPANSPFSDVNPTDTGYKAIVWLSSQGITVGYANGTFRPDTDISRKHMAFFLEKFYNYWD